MEEAAETSLSTTAIFAQRQAQLNNEIQLENFDRLLPSYVQNFVEHAAPLLGMKIEGDLAILARMGIADNNGQWLRSVGTDMPGGLPDFVTVRRDAQGVDVDPEAHFLPASGDLVFDELCAQILERFKLDVDRGGIFCDPSVEAPCFLAVYLCQVGSLTILDGKGMFESVRKAINSLTLG